MAKFDDGVNNVTVFDADKLNNINRALKDNVESSGQTIDASNTQSSKAIANYVGSANFYTDSGVANAYVLSTTGSFKSPTALVDGLEIRFRTSNPNTGASTINVAGLGVVNIKLGDGTSDIPSGFITNGSDIRLRYDTSNTAFIPSGYGIPDDLLITGKVNTQPNSATISSGAIAYTGAYMVVDTEGGASSDTLDTISGGTAGDRLLLRGATVNQDIIISDNTGNIQTNNSVNFTLEPIYGDSVEFFYNGSDWVQTTRRVHSDFLNYKGQNGYTYLPNGLIFQWGTYTPSSSKVTFPIAFPTAVLQVSVAIKDCSFNAAFSPTHLSTKIWSASGFYSQTTTNGIGATYYFQAIGY